MQLTRPRVAPRVPSLGGERAPFLVLAAGALLVALFSAWTGIHVTAVGLDENVYKYAAVQHFEGFPRSVFAEDVSRGAARLYSLSIAPIFELWTGDVAVRIARAWNAFLFAATAFPVALVARRVVRSPWTAVAAGLLSVAVPWLTLSTVLFSESLAYLGFAVAVLLMVRALEAPSVRRELPLFVLLGLLVLVRVQFLVLLPGWVLLVVSCELRDGRRGWRDALRRVRRRHPITLLALGIVALAVVAGAVTGGLKTLAGPYYGITDRGSVTGQFGLAGLWEVEMLAVGVGVVPAVLFVAWVLRALGDVARPDERRVALVAFMTIAAIFAGTLWAQGGWLGGSSEERYYIYAVPLVWIGALAAIERADLRRRDVVAVGLGFLAVFALVPTPASLVGEQAYLGPVSLIQAWELPRLASTFSRWIGLDGVAQTADVLMAIGAVLIVVALVLWWRGGAVRRLLLVPAIVLQLAVTGMAFASLHNDLDGVGGTVNSDLKFADLGWIDRALPSDARVTLLDNFTMPFREGGQRDTVFWNNKVTTVYGFVPAALPTPGFPVARMRIRGFDVGDDLVAKDSTPAPYGAGPPASPLWQLEGETVATARDGFIALQRISEKPKLRWAAIGLDVDGQLTRETPLRLAGGHRVTLDVAPPAQGQAISATFVLSGGRSYDVGGTEPQEVTLSACGRTGAVRGTAKPVTPVDIGGRTSGAQITAARVERC